MDETNLDVYGHRPDTRYSSAAGSHFQADDQLVDDRQPHLAA
jgi:hypothetical protein